MTPPTPEALALLVAKLRGPDWHYRVTAHEAADAIEALTTARDTAERERDAANQRANQFLARAWADQHALAAAEQARDAAVVSDQRCCGTCQFIDTTNANDGTGLCVGGGIDGWVPLTARCDQWATRSATETP
jgi:hypothetical protein